MNKLTLFFTIFLVTLFACKNSNSNMQEEGGEAVTHFGEVIDTSGMIPYLSLLTQMEGKDTVEAKVIGKVSGVCQAKGCWMNIVADDDSTKTEMFVKFKDYGFFMPKDLAGKNVVMLGKAYREITSVDDLKHFAEDEGLTDEEIAKITEPKEELKFMASGVMIK